MADSVQAFVLVGASPIRRPGDPAKGGAERRTKVENLFCCSIVIVKPGQKAEQRNGR